jgi:pimeloyl-ACP methyl ester carboxylesterase
MDQGISPPELPFSLPGQNGIGTIHGIVQTPPGDKAHPTVVICHGFKGFMEWGFFPPLADLLCLRGYTVIRFNFPGTGMLPGDALVTDPEAFKANTFSREQADIRRVLAAVGRTIAKDRVDLNRLALIGHSRGGAGVILTAGSKEWRGRLQAVISWAAVADLDYYDAAAKAHWRQHGELPVTNGRTGQELALGISLLRDLEGNKESLDLLAAAERIQAPWLIVHGGGDTVVPVVAAEKLQKRAKGIHELLILPEASHTFGAQHPFASPTPDFVQVLNATQTWLRRHLHLSGEPRRRRRGPSHAPHA